MLPENKLKKFGPNHDGRDFVVGDIHGMYDELMDGLKELNFDFDNDRLFSVGDLVDRGKKNQLCLKLIKEPWFHAVKGNHEVMMWNDQLLGDNWGWYNNYGKWLRRESYKSWGSGHSEMKRVIKLAMDTLPLAIEIEGKDGIRYGIVHAAVYEWDWNSVLVDENIAIWDRNQLKACQVEASYGLEPSLKKVENIDYVFYGHTPVYPHAPLMIGNRIYMDNGTFETKKFVFWELGAENEYSDVSATVEL